MDPHHRKIDLQSPQDLTYLLANIHAAAQQKVDIHFPPSAAPKGEEDAFRTRVEQLVQEYITHTLTLALPSLSINGLDASPALLQLNPPPSSSSAAYNSEPNYESYDPRLAAKLRSLYSTLESETTKVAELRREAPGKAAALYMERLRQEMEDEEGMMEERRRRAVEAGGGEVLEITGPGGVGLGDRWEGAVRGFEKLGGVTEAVARLERVKGVVEGVEGG